MEEDFYPFEFEYVSSYKRPKYDVFGDVWDQVVGLAQKNNDDSAEFHVLQHGMAAVDRPLVVWVHPGDACEFDTDDEEVKAYSFDFQEGMAEELLGMGQCDVVVLHRFSSEYAFENERRVDGGYYEAMAQVVQDERVSHLYGDDLDAASTWLLENMAVHGRPRVFLTGAWSHPDDGCVAAIGQALHAAGVTNMEVSPSSPSEPGSIENVWQPPAPEVAKKKAPGL